MSEDQRTDAEIIAASLDQPLEFKQLYIRHRRAMYKFAAKRVGSSNADDIVSSVFLKAFSARHRYHSEVTNALPWLYGIGKNTVGDFIRKQDSEILFVSIDLIPELVGNGDASPEVYLLREELSAMVNMALARMSDRVREPLLLYVLEDMSYSEIATVLGIPERTVATRIHRAKRRLGAFLGDISDTGHPWKEGEL